ncbi:MAG: VPLPA-CTERM sorting domain-containing protein [Pseudomonadota bacterium]
MENSKKTIKKLKRTGLAAATAMGAFVSQNASAVNAMLWLDNLNFQNWQVTAADAILNQPSPNIRDLALTQGNVTVGINIYNYENYLSFEGGSTRNETERLNTSFTGTIGSMDAEGNPLFSVFLSNSILTTFEGDRFGLSVNNPDYDPSEPFFLPNPDFDPTQPEGRGNRPVVINPLGDPRLRTDIPVWDTDGDLFGDMTLTFDQGNLVGIDYILNEDTDDDPTSNPLAGYSNRVRDLVNGPPEGFIINEVGFSITGDFAPELIQQIGGDEDILASQMLGDAIGLGANVFTSSGYIDLGADPVGSPVPVPGAVWLMGSALAGLTGMRRRTKKA